MVITPGAPLRVNPERDPCPQAEASKGPLRFTPAAESHGLWPWVNAPALGRDVAPLGHSLGATGFARGGPQDSLCSFAANPASSRHPPLVFLLALVKGGPGLPPPA
jgi:hypothetical protein